jgi:phage gpG-like protein
MIEVAVDTTKATARLDKMDKALHDALRAKALVLRAKLWTLVRQKLSGDVLNVRTGDLRSSIFQDEPENSADRVTERVAQGAQVKYGKIHEFGGKTKAHEILPTKKKALHFFGGFGMYGVTEVFAKKVNHPGSVIPERSFMRSSLSDMKAEIIAGLGGAATDAAAK